MMVTQRILVRSLMRDRLEENSYRYWHEHFAASQAVVAARFCLAIRTSVIVDCRQLLEVYGS